MWPGPDQWKWRVLLGLDSWLKSGTQGGYRLSAASGHTPPFCSGAFQPEMNQTLKGSREETCAFYGPVESTVPVACFLLDFQRSPNKVFWVGFGSLFKSPSLLLRANCPSSSSGTLRGPERWHRDRAENLDSGNVSSNWLHPVSWICDLWSQPLRFSGSLLVNRVNILRIVGCNSLCKNIMVIFFYIMMLALMVCSHHWYLSSIYYVPGSISNVSHTAVNK